MLTHSQDLRPMQLIFESASVNPCFSRDTCHSSLWQGVYKDKEDNRGKVKLDEGWSDK